MDVGQFVGGTWLGLDNWRNRIPHGGIPRQPAALPSENGRAVLEIPMPADVRLGTLPGDVRDGEPVAHLARSSRPTSYRRLCGGSPGHDYCLDVELRVDDVPVHFIEHGEGRPVIVLHGAGVDHREAEACFEPPLGARGGLRRIYPDLPGMGRTPAPDTLRSADDVLDVVLGFIDALAGQHPVLLVGHSAGGYYAREVAARRHHVAGLALVCALTDDVRDVPAHHPVVADADLGDEEFRGYFVIQTPGMLERHRTYVAPGGQLTDWAAMERIGRNWTFTAPATNPYPGPVLIVAGRQDSVVGYAWAAGAVAGQPHATVAVIDGAGHALPHEQPDVLDGLLRQWLDRVDAQAVGSSPVAPSARSRSRSR